MKGLIKKYFIEMKENLKFSICVILFISIFNFIGNNHYVALILLITTFPTLYLSSFNANKTWLKFEKVLPIGIKDIILSKYLYLLITLFSGIGLSVVYLLIYLLVNKEFSLYLSNGLLLSIGLVLSIATYIFPLSMKKRTGVLKYINLLILVFPTLHLYLCIKLDNYLLGISASIFPWSIYVISTLALFILSYFISISSYKKKSKR